MKSKKLLITTIFTTILSSIICHAELGSAPMPKVIAKKSSGPTLEETMQWVQNKVSSLPTTVVNYPAWNSQASNRHKIIFRDCENTIIVNESDGRIETTFISLQELDTEKSSFRQYMDYFDPQGKPIGAVYLEALGERNIFPWSGPNVFIESEARAKSYYEQQINQVKNHPVKYVSGVYLKLPDLDSAKSLFNAFKHASELCKEKAVLVEASKPKDLF